MIDTIYRDGKLILTSIPLVVEKGRVLQVSLGLEYKDYSEKQVQAISDVLKEWLNKDFDAKDEYEQKIGELQTITAESGELASKIYHLIKDDKLTSYKLEILEDVMEYLRLASQRIGWIDTREFDNTNEL